MVAKAISEVKSDSRLAIFFRYWILVLRDMLKLRTITRDSGILLGVTFGEHPEKVIENLQCESAIFHTPTCENCRDVLGVDRQIQVNEIRDELG